MISFDLILYYIEWYDMGSIVLREHRAMMKGNHLTVSGYRYSLDVCSFDIRWLKTTRLSGVLRKCVLFRVYPTSLRI